MSDEHLHHRVEVTNCVDEDCNTYEFECQQKEDMEKQLEERKTILNNHEQIKTNQEEIKETLKLMQQNDETLNGTVGRIFKLYEEHDVEIKTMKKENENLKISMKLREATNGKNEETTRESKADIKEIVVKREKIYNRLTSLETTKADKEDITKILVAVEKVGTTLDNHCKQDEKMGEDKKYTISRWEKILFFIVGTIISVVTLINVLVR